MPLVTLISDFGNVDYRIPAVKGMLYTHIPNLQVVDISHEIEPNDYISAARILKNCYKNFPLNSVHIIGIEGSYVGTPAWVMAKVNQHFFFVRDNGMLSMISDREPEWAYQLFNGPKDLKFPMKDILAKNAIALLSGKKRNEIGLEYPNLVRKILAKPSISKNRITGVIAEITNDQIVRTNIHQRDFNTFKEVKDINLPEFPRMTYAHAIEKYGIDKPDLRFGMEINEITSLVQNKGHF